MVYLIDGTNLIRRLYTDGRKAPAEEDVYARELIEGLCWLASRGAGRHGFRLVFDGYPRRYDVERVEGVDLFFGGEGGADRVLLDQARYLASLGRAPVVVTADGELQDLAAREGARAMLPEEFLRKFRLGRS